MKVSDIIKEGVLSSLVKGMAKGAGLARPARYRPGLGDVTLAKRPGRLPSAVTTQTTQTTQTTPKQDPIQRDKQPIPGFDVISNDPLIVRYDKIDYTLNDQGEWSKLVQGRREPAPLSQSLTRALDKVAGLVDNPQAEPEPETVRSELPDISQLSPQEREELKKRLKASLKVGV